MKIRLRLIIFGKHPGTHLSSLINSAFGEQDYNLAKLGIRAFRDEEGHLQMRVQQALHLLNLNLYTTRTDDIIFTSQNAKLITGACP